MAVTHITNRSNFRPASAALAGANELLRGHYALVKPSVYAKKAKKRVFGKNIVQAAKSAY